MIELPAREEWNETFDRLPRYAPRSGYTQRFWARVDNTAPSPGRLWRWLPVAATAFGLLAGVTVAGLTAAPRPAAPVAAFAAFPEGSLTGTLAFKAGE